MNKITDVMILEALRLHGTERAAADALGMAKSTFHDRKARLLGDANSPAIKISTPSKGIVKRFIVSAVQNDTPVDRPFFKNIKAYAKYHNAELLVLRLPYKVKKDSKWGVPSKYITDTNYQISDRLLICSKMNISPTASDPVSGLDNYAGSPSVIIGHTKLRMHSVPVGKGEDNKFIYTTGVLTDQNYEQKKAGLKSEFHHCKGALIVELCDDNSIFVRQLLCDDSKGFYDLDKYVVSGKVHHSSDTVHAAFWGDIHVEKLDPVVANKAFGIGGCSDNLLDTFRPKKQFLHDLIDFETRNHHNINNHMHRYLKFIQKDDSVLSQMNLAGELLISLNRSWTSLVVVESNHDQAFQKWLDTADFRDDPANMEFFLESKLAQIRDVRMGVKHHALKSALLRTHLSVASRAEFLFEDDPYYIGGKDRGIRCDVHGHTGSNGGKGSPKVFTKLNTRMVTGHTHSPCIIEGVWVTPVFAKMEMGYNKGSSSWAQGCVFAYNNLKRTMLIMDKGRFYADQSR